MRVRYAPATGATDITRAKVVAPTRQQTDQGASQPGEIRRGEPEEALVDAEVKVDETYIIPRENHIHHATGKRVRELPVTPDKLLF